MRLETFFSLFPNEEACVECFKEIKIKLLPPCPLCGGTKYYFLKRKRAFECKSCKYRTPLTKDTVMEYSKLPLRSWFLAMQFMTSIKQVMSAREIQFQINSENYQPIWFMMMKLRDIMGKRDAKYKLSGQVELDEAFFPTRLDSDQKDEPLKRGAGSQKQTKVLVIIESKPTEEAIIEEVDPAKIDRLEQASKIYPISKIVKYLKMFVLEDLNSSTIDTITKEALLSSTKIVSDGSKSHVNLKKFFREHEVHVEDDVDFVVREYLPWVHIVIGDCKSGIEAVHKEIDPEFLQYYLNEYCWKFNRRRFREPDKFDDDIFFHLVKTAAQYKSDLKWENIISKCPDPT